MSARRFAPALLIFVLILLASCQSVGTRVVESVPEESYRELERYGETLAVLQASPDDGELARVRRELESLAARENLDKPYRARVLGLYAQAEWLAGREASARRLLQLIEETWPAEARLYVLRSFLAPPAGKVGILESGLAAVDQPALLRLYLGEQYLALGQYAAAAAAFDEAFAGLPGTYRELYGAKRDLAFQMRDRDAPATRQSARALELAELTAEAMLHLTLQETRFLEHIVPRGVDTVERLLPELGRSGYLPPSITTPNDPVRRAEAAFFASRLVAWLENDPDLLHSYSDIYARGGASPVPDVPVRSPYFDAVLALVEREILDLPDGIHFYPDRPLSGAQFYAALTRMKELYR